MPDFSKTWLGLRCLEFSLHSDPSPRLFHALSRVAEQLRRDRLVVGANSSYSSLSVFWAELPSDQTLHQVEQVVQVGLADLGSATLETREHRLPVHYDGEDLAAVAEYHQLTVDNVISRHKLGEYTIAAIGFLPYFAYLWGLDGELTTPRRPTPRSRVPAGSVAIGGGQTAVYPQDSPGGWHIIGSVDLDVFHERKTRFQVGDRIVFEEL